MRRTLVALAALGLVAGCASTGPADPSYVTYDTPAGGIRSVRYLGQVGNGSVAGLYRVEMDDGATCYVLLGFNKGGISCPIPPRAQ